MNITRGARKLQRGQALVLIILAIAAIFGFSALAVDVGQIFMVRRSAQAAADAAAMAAAYEATAGSMDEDAALAKAFEMAGTNGYNNDTVSNWVTVKHPPTAGDNCGICGTPQANEYYYVKISVMMKPIFAQFVYGEKSETTVYAVAHAKEIGTLSSEDAILSLSHNDDSFTFNGGINVTVDGGNIRATGKMTNNGSIPKKSDPTIVVTNGAIYYGTTWKGPNIPFSPKPRKDVAGALSSFREPWCPTAAETNDGSWSSGSGFKTKVINSVNYYYYPSGLSVENLPKGIHCVDAKKTGSNYQDAISKGNFTGNGVLIVLLHGGLKLTGGDSLDLRAPLDIIDANGNHFGGLVFYAPVSNTAEMQFGGNMQAYWQGTFFAPGSLCKVGGNSSGVGYNASFICDKIVLHGNEKLKINYRAENNYRLPPYVELVE